MKVSLTRIIHCIHTLTLLPQAQPVASTRCHSHQSRMTLYQQLQIEPISAVLPRPIRACVTAMRLSDMAGLHRPIPRLVQRLVALVLHL